MTDGKSAELDIEKQAELARKWAALAERSQHAVQAFAERQQADGGFSIANPQSVAQAFAELTAKMNKKVAPQVTDAVTRVYEACGFQDITGQRITKVVTALKQIEKKVEALLEAFGQEFRRPPDQEQSERKPRPDKPGPPHGSVMHGPQLEKDANSQDDIDAILASLD